MNWKEEEPLWKILETVDNPYERLGILINYSIYIDAPEGHKIEDKIKTFTLQGKSAAKVMEELVRNYCEITCSCYPIDIITMLPDWLILDLMKERFGSDKKKIAQIPAEDRPEWVALQLKFEKPIVVNGGFKARIRQLQDSLDKLTNAFISRQEVTGCGLDAHNSCVEILKDILKFYGRYLWGNDPTLERWIEAIDLKEKEAEPLRKWVNPQGYSREKYTLDLGELEKVFLRWNNTILQNPTLEWVISFQTAFSRDEILPSGLFDILRSIRFGRGEFAHSDAPERIELSEYRELAQADLESALTFIGLLDENAIFPKTIVMQRLMMLESGEARLDYLNEQGELNYVRFLRGPIDFYPRVPLYYYQPMTLEESMNPTVLTSQPIFIPVAEKMGGEV